MSLDNATPTNLLSRDVGHGTIEPHKWEVLQMY